MSMTDPIADLLTRIRNGSQERHDRISVPASRIKANIVRVLKQEGYLKNFRLTRDKRGHPYIRVYLKYTEKGTCAIRGLRRVSRPGLRRYTGHKTIRNPVSGAGVAILSTSRGVMAGQQAKKEKVGGEILCEVW